MSTAKDTKTAAAAQEPDIKAMNIFQKLEAITAELGTVAKNLAVKAGGGSYKAVSERDIIDAVKPLEYKYGIYSYPCDREILESAVLENEKSYNGNVTKTSTFFTRMKTTYRFVNIDNPEESITTIVFSEGIDTQDKGSGKGMTYADKYALMKAYKISTGDDPDQNGSEETTYQKARTQPQRNYSVFKCTDCGRTIQDAKRNDGSIMAAGDVAQYSIKRFGAALCVDCQRKRNGSQG